ncbi:uncharacterized protein LOC112842157 [Oreochromis niloticus]|uniref:uncharacterized protein LOC112842157 n=1 Tax=Oreochromis niloticus TaxID=8128 RepID=UPI000DF31F1A|nr:uncharacterized protein LOC112842157 [Oreochromis niloticus]
MFVFSVFLTIAIVSMNMASTDNPCDPHCQQIYRQYPSVTCSEQSAVPKQDHRTTEKVELTRKKRSFCRGHCYGVAGARKYDNPCNQTATLKKTEDLYLCYHKTSFSSAVWIPLNSFHIGGRRGDEWNEYDWYLSSTDWDQGWDTVFTYTGNDWTPYSEYWLANSAKNWSKTINMTKTSTHLILNFHTEKLPLAETPLAMSVRTWDHFTNSPCYHLTLFVYRKHANDPHTYLSICSNITKIGTNDTTKDTKNAPVLTVGPHTYMTRVVIVGPELEADDLFKITTGISGHSNNWLLLAEQAAQDANDDCMVCLGPRPTLRLVPSPVEEHCLIPVMNHTNVPGANCSRWDTIFPVTGPEKTKPIFSRDVTGTNHMCINMTGPGERIGSLNSSNCLSITNVNETFKPISRADVWWWCGDPQIYDRMPRDWTGVCGLVSLLLPVQVVKLSVTDITTTSREHWPKTRKKRAAPEKPGPDPTYIDAIGVPRGVPDEYKLVDQVAAGFESSVCWWCTINKNVDRINYIHYNVQRLGNLTQAGFYAVAEQLRATSLMSFQNRIALDMLLSEKNGVCSMFGEQCCTFIPNNTAADGSLTRALEGLKTLNEKMKEHSGVDTLMWDSWMDMFGKYRSLVSSILVSIAVFAAILTLCGCCCIPCIRALINRLIATAITPDPVSPRETMTLLEHTDTDTDTDDDEADSSEENSL